VESWRVDPDAISPRQLEVILDAEQYPVSIEAARLDIRWFEGGDYTIHYLEHRGDDRWQCRWDRHPKPDAPSAHFYPPPDAASAAEPSDISAGHHLDVLFTVLEWIESRVEALH